MTDLHTHILPRMDDGAPDTAASLAMLRMEAAQGVTGVALTPHFHRDRESIEWRKPPNLFLTLCWVQRWHGCQI